jgi:hypothetical protein
VAPLEVSFSHHSLSNDSLTKIIQFNFKSHSKMKSIRGLRINFLKFILILQIFIIQNNCQDFVFPGEVNTDREVKSDELDSRYAYPNFNQNFNQNYEQNPFLSNQFQPQRRPQQRRPQNRPQNWQFPPQQNGQFNQQQNGQFQQQNRPRRPPNQQQQINNIEEPPAVSPQVQGETKRNKKKK